MADINLTPIQTFVSGDIVLPDDLNQLAQSTVALTAGTVTVADLATATVERLLPAGAVMPFARATAPAGWLIANGDAVPNGSGTVQGVTADFSALYAAVSTSFGTVGTLPDLRGIFVRGSGDQTISGTAYSKAFALKETDSFRAHTHDLGSRVNATAFGTGIVAGSNSPTVNGNNNPTESTGGTETRPANIALLYCIKF